MHDAIMIGVGTAINDDPRLNGEREHDPVCLHGLSC